MLRNTVHDDGVLATCDIRSPNKVTGSATFSRSNISVFLLFATYSRTDIYSSQYIRDEVTLYRPVRARVGMNIIYLDKDFAHQYTF